MELDVPSGNLDSLVFDLVEWVAKEPRTYAQVMDAWRTSCPRLTVWEEAVDRELLVRRGRDVAVTKKGQAFLRRTRAEGAVSAANMMVPFPRRERALRDCEEGE